MYCFRVGWRKITSRCYIIACFNWIRWSWLSYYHAGCSSHYSAHLYLYINLSESSINGWVVSGCLVGAWSYSRKIKFTIHGTMRYNPVANITYNLWHDYDLMIVKCHHPNPFLINLFNKNWYVFINMLIFLFRRLSQHGATLTFEKPAQELIISRRTSAMVWSLCFYWR